MPDCIQLLRRRHAIGGGFQDPFGQLPLKTRDPDHKIFIKIVGKNGKELYAFKQRVTLIPGLVKHVPVEPYPAQFAVDVKGRIVGKQLRSIHFKTPVKNLELVDILQFQYYSWARHKINSPSVNLFLDIVRKCVSIYLKRFPAPGQESSVKVMVPVAVVDELLFPVLTAIERGPEVPDPGCLLGWTERAKGRVHVPSFLPHRAVVNPLDQLHGITPGKRSANRVARFVKNEHAERCEQVVEETYAVIAVAGSSTLTDHHVPVGFLLVRDRFLHRTE
jgi:hypothetical protein